MLNFTNFVLGADFIKTSTGKEGVNAILPVGLVMVRAIREYHYRTGFKVSILCLSLIHRVSKKTVQTYFLSELCQISTDFKNFWHNDSRENRLF